MIGSKLLSPEESSDRADRSADYAKLAELMFDDVTVSKRNTLSLSQTNSIDVTNLQAPPGSYQKMASAANSSGECISIQESGGNRPKPPNGGYISIREANETEEEEPETETPLNNGYISVQMAQTHPSPRSDSAYITMEDAKKNHS